MRNNDRIVAGKLGTKITEELQAVLDKSQDDDIIPYMRAVRKAAGGQGLLAPPGFAVLRVCTAGIKEKARIHTKSTYLRKVLH